MRMPPVPRALRLTGATVAAALALTTVTLAAGPARRGGEPCRVPRRGSWARRLPGTRFFVPPPDQGAIQQEFQLAKSGDVTDAGLLARMEATPQAVWFASGTPAQVRRRCGRPCCRRRSSAPSGAGRQRHPGWTARSTWRAGRSTGRRPGLDQRVRGRNRAGPRRGHPGARRARQPAVGLQPADLGYRFSDAERFAELNYAVGALEQDPGASVYLDGTHSAWQSVGTITQRLLATRVQQAQGFFLDVSNYQPPPS